MTTPTANDVHVKPSASKTKFDLPPKPRSEKDRAKRILDALYREYPDAHCELVYANPRELLVATILSAQATDVSVNKATPALFERFQEATDYAAVNPQRIERYIRSIGLYRNNPIPGNIPH